MLYVLYSKHIQVIIVPFLDGILGAEIPAYTWLGAFLSVLGVGILELSGSPPCVSRISTCKGPQVCLNVFICLMVYSTVLSQG